MAQAERNVRASERDLERLRRCLAEGGIDPNLAQLHDRYGVGVDTLGMDENELRLVWRAYRLAMPEQSQPDFELWKSPFAVVDERAAMSTDGDGRSTTREDQP